MADRINSGITGNTFGIQINETTGDVKIGGEEFIVDDIEQTRLFLHAYRLGRDHKKMEIRKVLSVN